MAELLTVVRSQVDKTAGRKTPAAIQNRVRVAVIQSAAVYAAPGLGDTAGTGLTLKQGSRILCPVTVSNGAGTAAGTLSVGLRNPITKVAIDPTAVVAACAITAAATAQVNTGSKVTAGQEYYLPEDAELYLTFSGAVGTANQAIRVEVSYVSP